MTLLTRRVLHQQSRDAFQSPLVAQSQVQGLEGVRVSPCPLCRHICDAQRSPPLTLGHVVTSSSVGFPPSASPRPGLTLPEPRTRSIISSWNISSRIELERDQPGGARGKSIWSPKPRDELIYVLRLLSWSWALGTAGGRGGQSPQGEAQPGVNRGGELVPEGDRALGVPEGDVGSSLAAPAPPPLCTAMAA